MLENKTQKKIIDYCNSLWYITVDLIKTNLNWIADLLVCTWDKKHFWVEVKQETWKMSEIQKYRQKQFESMWDVRITCYWYKDFINKYLEKIW
jgi:hypothetical protein